MNPTYDFVGQVAVVTGEQEVGTPLRITFGDTELTARLQDNATAAISLLSCR